MTGKALSALREAVKADDLARDKALMASPQLAIEHLADGVSLRIDGADLDVPIGTTNQRRVHGELVMEMGEAWRCLLYTSPSPRDLSTSRMPSSA